MEIERDDLFSLAERYVESTGVSVFLTGKAGTGKTTFLRHITSTTAKRYVVLAPTGVAAINAGGSTIHSFFQLPLCPYLPDVKELVTEYQMPDRYRTLPRERVKIIRTLDMLVIDEISMVRADLLDAVDMTLRRYRRDDRPFGGVQLLMIGDAQQLSPVVKDNERPYLERVYPSPYFFSSKALQSLPYVTVELQKVHRQKDAEFLEILNAIRCNSVTPSLLERLNRRVGASLEAGRSEPIRLTTHNRQADSINQEKLAALPGEAVQFGAEVEGEFPENSYPAEEVLSLKKGAQVMFIRNDSDGQYYNGKIARVESIASDGTVTVCDDDGLCIDVAQAQWDNTQYSLDASSGEIRPTVVGSFRQLPLRTAWAITIHKSQGLTFDRVIIDAGSAFAFGQVYVALSRCRSLEGISLERPIHAGVIYSDRDVAGFNESFQSLEQVRGMLDSEQRRYRFDQMRALFTFDRIGACLGWLQRLWRDSLDKTYPSKGEAIRAGLKTLDEASAVAVRFRSQLVRLEAEGAEDEYVAERLLKAAEYFHPLFNGLLNSLSGLTELEIDNREQRKRVREAGEELLTQLDIVCQSLEMIRERGWSAEGYARIRSLLLCEDGRRARARRLRRVVKAEGEPASVNEALRERLTEWRSRRFKEENVPAYKIMHQSTLLAIAQHVPTTKAELLAIDGFGRVSFDKYGEEILALCRESL